MPLTTPAPCNPHPPAEAETFNAGLAEVGGAQWKEVLGREAEARRSAEVAAQSGDAQGGSTQAGS